MKHLLQYQASLTVSTYLNKADGVQELYQCYIIKHLNSNHYFATDLLINVKSTRIVPV